MWEGVDEDRLHVIPQGVHASLFEGPFEDPFAGMGKPRILFVGRLAPQKGVSTLVAAAGLLEDPSALVLLVGDGPERICWSCPPSTRSWGPCYWNRCRPVYP